MLTSEACIKQFIEDHSFRLEKWTLEAYQVSIVQLLNYCGKPYNEITARDIRNWMIDLEEHDYKRSSIKQKMVGLRLFYQYCVEEKLITQNPVESVPHPKTEDKLPHYLDMGQLAQLRQLVEGRLKQKAVVELLYTSGVRIRELTAMKKEAIIWSERMIHIPKGKGKKERIVLFTKQCAEYLEAYIQSQSVDLPYVFLDRYSKGPLDPRSIQHWFEGYREEMGIYLTPHTLRHTFAAHLAMKGMPISFIQVLLGHENPSNTHLYARLHSHAQKQKYDEWM